MPTEHPAPGHEEAQTRGERTAPPPFAEPPRAAGTPLTRRAFVSTAGLAALGVVAGCAALPGTRSSSPQSAQPAASESPSAVVSTQRPPVGAGWKPLASLAAVAVATDAHATHYPALTDLEAFDAHPATKLLERALTAVTGAAPVTYVRSLVKAGGTVLVKPNWVEPASWADGKITHPSLVIAVARIAADAVGPSGRVIIAEGTSEGLDLPKILAATGFRTALKRLAPPVPGRAPIDIVDLNARSGGRLSVALGRRSRFSAVDAVMYDAHGKSMGEMGGGRVGRYLLAQPIVDADLIIDLAKSKVHCSAGVTLALKNFVGIVPSDDGPYGDGSMKDIPHYSADDVESGAKYVANKTIGRAAADLHALAGYVARDGSLQSAPQRKLLCIIDGVVSGQRSQFNPDPVATGFIVVGTDPVAVDHVATRCMGFDPPKVHSLQPARGGAIALGTADPAHIRIAYDGSGSFCGYFSARRRLEPESLQAEWGDTMALRAFDLGTPKVEVAGGRLVVTTTADAPMVRAEANGRYVQLARSGSRTFQTAWPYAESQPVRVALIDKHFNLAEKTLTA